MSKLNINKTEWLELVFEGRNKAYGAYQLRQEEGRTTMKAFFSALVLIAGIATLPLILSSFTDKPIVETPLPFSPPITPVNLQPKTEQPKKLPTSNKSAEPKVPKLAIPVVVKKEDAPKTDIPRNADLPKTPTTTETPGTGPATVGPTTGPATVEIPTIEDPNKVLPPSMLEQNPAFPGGIGEFLKIVGNRFVAPEIDEEKTVKVIVYFVVEKDGTLSNINVPRSPGYSLDKEAIRVLKSIKTKWEPGIYKGKPVRTSYSLPIVIKMTSI